MQLVQQGYLNMFSSQFQFYHIFIFDKKDHVLLNNLLIFNILSIISILIYD